MNREEAARILDPSTMDLEFEKDISHWSERLDLAMAMGVEALRSPQPDPVTGLVPCGGRKAVMWCTPGEGYWVASGKIGQINGFATEMAAKEAWNAAMGYKEQ